MNLVEEHMDEIIDLCEEHKVDRIYLFGSASTGEFSQKSDIDFLVKFEEMDLMDYFENYMNLKQNLEKVLGRQVDLLEEQTLKNPILIQSIDRDKKLLYG